MRISTWFTPSSKSRLWWLKEWQFLEGDARERLVSERRRYERRIDRLFLAAVHARELPEYLDRRHAVLLFFSVGNWAYDWLSQRTNVDAEADALWGLMLGGLRGEGSA